ncbi:hypothetical protein C0989_006907 [Termitomyces sp. Mn162]|nr:hypothetical protein C0989_006907 [Termitomyces sp. Mn162]
MNTLVRLPGNVLNILNDVAQEVLLPAFGVAVKIAVKSMKTIDDSQASLESADELKTRIQELFKVMVDKLKGKKPDEIHPELISEIDRLQTFVHFMLLSLICLIRV